MNNSSLNDLLTFLLPSVAEAKWTHLVSKGLDLVTRNNVLRVRYAASRFALEGEVLDGKIYRCDLTASSSGEARMACSCGKQPCSHAFAIMIQAASRQEAGLAGMLEQARARQKKGVRGKASKKRAKVKMLDKKPANIYRALKGLTKTADRNYVINQWATENEEAELVDMHVYYGKQSKININGVFEVPDRYRYWEKEQKDFEVDLKVDEAKLISIKCNTCTKKSSKLCLHQTMAVKYMERTGLLTDILSGQVLDYDYVLEMASAETGLRKDQVEKYYALEFFEGGIGLSDRPDKPLLVTPSAVEFDRIFTNWESETQDAFVALDDKKSMGYAVVWEPKGAFAVEGKYNKARTILASRIEEIEPEYIRDPSMRMLTGSLFMMQEANDEYAAYHFIKSHLSEFAQWLNYYYKGDRFYSQKVRKSDLKKIQLHPEPIVLRAKITHDDNVSNVDFELYCQGTSFKPSDIVESSGALIVNAQKHAYLLADIKMRDILRVFQERDQVSYIRGDEKVEAMHRLLTEAVEVVVEGMTEEELQNGQRQLWMRQAGRYVFFEPVLLYDSERFNILETSESVDLTEEHRYYANVEEVATFRNALDQIFETKGITDILPHQIGVTLEDFHQGQWFVELFEQAGKAGIELYGEDKIENFGYSTKTATVSMNISSGIDWFDTNVEMAFGDIAVPTKAWVEAVRKGDSFVKLSDGSKGALPTQWVDKLKTFTDVGEVQKGGGIRISKMHFNALDNLFEEIDDDELKEEINAKKLALANYDSNKKYTLPKGLKATLRPYQKQSFQWMKFLEEYGFGGCLADDMGLGKTLQMITILLDQKHQKKGTSLIVIPRSLLFNWAAEIEKFAPQLNFQIHHGSTRDKTLESYEETLDCLISTYDTVTVDIEVFAEHEFNYVILDESQAIKNPNSKRYKAMRLLKGRHRIAMTGTPIENSTFDLYAQMSFLNPGLLGSSKTFKDRFATPIDGRGDVAQLEVLKKVIHPFLLRRTKENVAADLPEKTETILYCEMDRVQRKLYDDLRLSIKQDIEGMVAQQGVAQSKFKILDGLLRLRQMCNAPVLVNKALPAKKQRSAKLDSLMEQLQDLGGHKALVFSQFVGMLQLIKERLDQLGITYAYLDGSTTNRQAAVETFMKEDQCQVFLISIKAGNTGLNLTKAEYVYIVDPWWNPAVEAQAIDRTHRIGQDQHVFAYKMICKDTIEEKIVKLQSSKKKLAQDLIQVDESVFKSLDKQELLALFD